MISTGQYTIVAVYDGVNGADGRSVTGVTEYYLASASSSGVTTGTSGWTTSVQTITATLKYLWNYEKVDYSDGSSTMTNPVIIGAYGNTGNTGPAGKSISSVTEYYLATSASSGVTTSTTGWSTTMQTTNNTNKYLWNYEVITYSDATTTTIAPVIIGIQGDVGPQGATGATGPTGATGKGISSITEYYLATNVNTGVTTATTGWSTTVPTITSTNKYLWNYEKITYTDASTTNSTPAVIGVYGDQGIQGPTGPSGTSQYVHIRYSANADGSAFTTTPQTDTAYIGIANTTSSTAPTLNTGYTWSLFKGPQGNTGIQGPTGANGQTYWTWVKYADDVYGGNMSDTPAGKRYVGFAFNKTTSTESTIAGDYQWSPLYDNVHVGARNLIFGSGDGTGWTGATTINPDTGELTEDASGSTEKYFYSPYLSMWGNQEVTLSFEAKATANVSTMEVYLLPDDYSTTGLVNKQITKATDWTKYSFTFTTPSGWGAQTTPNSKVRARFDNNGSSDANPSTISVRKVKLELGNVSTDWSPAPEDIDAQIGYKASIDDLNALGQIVTDLGTDVGNKAEKGDLDQLISDYNDRMAQDIKDKAQLSSDLSTLEGRTTLVETMAGNSKIVTDFVNTVITQSAEGIYISNKASSTGILIKSDRISFLSNNVEVAYISNQTMQINHGIFVQSATIGNFKFEPIPSSPTILAVQWVGG